jgi:hypothetical protein
MNKKQNGSAILAGIAITAILVASSLIAGNQFTQQAHAQATTTPPSTTTTTPKPTAGTPEPRAGQTVNWQGTVSSIPSPLAGHKEDVAIILPLRKDGGLYTGVVTFTASKGVSVQVWNELSGVSATTPIGKEFGKLSISPSANGKFVATSDVGTGDTSGSVPFAGNALALVGKSPFIATYSVTAQATTGKVTNNLTSAASLAAAGATTALGGAGGSTGALTLGGAAGGTTTSGGGSSGTSGGGSSGTSGGGSSGTSGGGSSSG